jgi:hypothetical protein
MAVQSGLGEVRGVSGTWAEVAHDFHERVRANCWDTMSWQLAELHRPWLCDEQPVCRGCDRDERGTTDPVWPCRTYTIIAGTMLNLVSVEATLAGLMDLSKRV